MRGTVITVTRLKFFMFFEIHQNQYSTLSIGLSYTLPTLNTMKFTTLSLLLTISIKLSLIHSFGFHQQRITTIATTTTLSSKSNQNQDNSDNDDDTNHNNSSNNDERTGMKDAFQSLEGLSSLEDFDSSFSTSESKKKSNITLDDIKTVLQEAKDKTNGTNDDITSSTAAIGKENNSNEDMEELKLYSDMYKEMEENEDGALIYGDILGELKGENEYDDLSTSNDKKTSTTGKGFGKTKVMNDADGIGSISKSSDTDEEELRAVELSQDTDEFMRQALEEAMQEVGKDDKGRDKLAAELIKDEEIMKEINAIFDRANEELLKGVAEIKAEQQALTDASAKKRSKSLAEDDKRLKEAEESVEKLVAKVRKETLEVEEAVKNLEAVQAELSKDPVMRAVSIKSGGIVSQGALVGAILFSFRSVAELFMLSGPDGSSHIVPAAVQALIAAACAAYLTFATK